MNAQELHDIMGTLHDAMTDDGLWPWRHGCELVFVYASQIWRWGRLPIDDRDCDEDDAHNAFVVALLGWALSHDMELWPPCDHRGFAVKTSPGHHEDGPTILHALVTAYKYAKGL